VLVDFAPAGTFEYFMETDDGLAANDDIALPKPPLPGPAPAVANCSFVNERHERLLALRRGSGPQGRASTTRNR